MSKAVLRTLAVVETLKGQTLHGLSNREIADAIGDTLSIFPALLPTSRKPVGCASWKAGDTPTLSSCCRSHRPTPTK